MSEINRVQQLYVDHLHQQNSGQPESRRGSQAQKARRRTIPPHYLKPEFNGVMRAVSYQWVYM
jgi:hypothetical protein